MKWQLATVTAVLACSTVLHAATTPASAVAGMPSRAVMEQKPPANSCAKRTFNPVPEERRRRADRQDWDDLAKSSIVETDRMLGIHCQS